MLKLIHLPMKNYTFNLVAEGASLILKENNFFGIEAILFYASRLEVLLRRRRRGGAGSGRTIIPKSDDVAANNRGS
jgi:hypothetical protein